MIVSRDKIRRAVEVAMKLDTKHSVEDAVAAVAQAMSLPREVVLQALEPVGNEVAAC